MKKEVFEMNFLMNMNQFKINMYVLSMIQILKLKNKWMTQINNKLEQY